LIRTKEKSKALDTIVKIVREEAVAQDPGVLRAYGVTLRRIFTNDAIKQLAPFLIDEVYAADVILIMRRAGTQATKILLDFLIEAPTQAERRAFLNALRQADEGADAITSLLNHHEWFVVRNAADLVGELRIPEAVPALGKVVDHQDARVRRSVGVALARIGTPSAAQYLRKVFSDPDPQTRVAVVKELGGRGLGGLAMPLVSAVEGEEDQEVVSEYYRALGRIGTPDAVKALSRVARETTGFFARGPSVSRLAAVEALGTAGGPAAKETLQGLLKDRAGDVRKLAGAALEEISKDS